MSLIWKRIVVFEWALGSFHLVWIKLSLLPLIGFGVLVLATAGWVSTHPHQTHHRHQ